jgi:hypothetical protein
MMAKITITIDTEEKTLGGTIEGKEIQGDITSASFYKYEGYDRKKTPELSWTITVLNETGDDDVKSYTNWCAASQKLGTDINKAKADISDFFAKQRRR